MDNDKITDRADTVIKTLINSGRIPMLVERVVCAYTGESMFNTESVVKIDPAWIAFKEDLIYAIGCTIWKNITEFDKAPGRID